MAKKIVIIVASITACCVLLVINNPMFLLLPMALSGQYSGLRSETPMPEAHEYAVNSFVKSEGFGYSRMRRKSLWNERSISYREEEYQVGRIELIGLTPEYGERYFEGDRPTKKSKLNAADHRELTVEEESAIDSLLNGETEFAKLTAEEMWQGVQTIRLVALIHARDECLRCHDSNVGDALGAFSYSLYGAVPLEE